MINKKKRIFDLTGPVDFDMYRKALAMCHSFDGTARVIMYLNTTGGYVSDGFAIHDLLRLHFPKLTIIATGEVMSSGCVILCAADSRLSLPNTEFMIHYGENSAGSASEARANARSIKDMKKIIANKSNTGEKIVKEWFEKETYFSAKQALKVGLITEIIGDKSGH